MSGASESDECVTANGRVYIPEVRNEETPAVGMKFDSLDLVYNFYNRYAFLAGFDSTKVLTKQLGSVNIPINQKKYRSRSIIYVDKMSGASESDECVTANGRVYIPEVRNEETPAVGMKFDSLDLVYNFYNRYAFLAGFDSTKVLTKQLGSVNIPINQKVSIFEVQSGGMDKIGFIRKDIYNLECSVNGKLRNHDVELVTEYFMAEQKKNEAFYFKIEGDGDNRFSRCFWADATSRRAYGFYGDVVVFDTTFNTNRYDLTFAPMLGVNNHGQTIVLACAFLSKETTESFIWMFEEFKKAMPGGEPKTIITDQDAAMSRAISIAFPTTFHRLCIWHITSKFSVKLPHSAYKEYWGEFQKAI
ncbi:PREDICTED: protein FAR1-RELATED SEQUENCE 5-like [Prunus mume]|uniref:Protein FAR1-RELATED SEQUENCE 5-like n=1 Tax=Prunus mume TaxID=102107 RepID=A0ABM0P1R4_PRUMU|nr:PREDICTED: protein FAR1-RELATED SEQUENCE 5-like [Prunus mume]